MLRRINQLKSEGSIMCVTIPIRFVIGFTNVETISALPSRQGISVQQLEADENTKMYWNLVQLARIKYSPPGPHKANTDRQKPSIRFLHTCVLTAVPSDTRLSITVPMCVTCRTRSLVHGCTTTVSPNPHLNHNCLHV